MKKEMVKALSIGLSAATLAGSMDITAFAAEGEENTTEENVQAVVAETTMSSTAESIDTDTQKLADDFNTSNSTIISESTSVDENTEDVLSAEQKEAIADAETAVQNADGYIDNAAEDTEALAQAASNYESVIATGNEQVDAATEAAANTSSAAQDVENAIADASVAVENSATKEEAEFAVEVAAGAVEDAKAAFDTAETNYNNALSAVEQAKLDLVAAQEAFNNAKADSVEELTQAQQKLEAAISTLETLEGQLKTAQQELINSGAQALVDAEDKKDESTTEYIKSIFKLYLGVEDKNLAVEEINDGDASIKVTFDDGTVKTYKLDTTDGKVAIYETELRYEVKDADGNITESLTKTQLQTMLDNKTAFARYYVDGSYYTEETLKNKGLNTADYTPEYILVGDYIATTETNLDSTIDDGEKRSEEQKVDVAEDYENEAITSYSFDPEGNLIKTVVYPSLNIAYTYKNGSLQDSKTISKTMTAAEAEADVKNMMNNAILVSADGNSYTIISQSNSQTASWNVNGFALVTDGNGKLYLTDDTKRSWIFIGNDSLLKRVITNDKNLSNKYVNISETELAELQNLAAKDGKIPYASESVTINIGRFIKIPTLYYKVYFVGAKSVNNVTVADNDFAVTEDSAKYAAVGQGFSSDSRLDTTRTMDYSYAYRILVTDSSVEGTYEKNYSYISKNFSMAQRVAEGTTATFDNTDVSYTSVVQAAREKLAAYKALLKDVETARANYEEAKATVEKIKSRIESLNKITDIDVAAQTQEWDNLLVAAENNYNDAKSIYDKAEENLQNLTNSVDEKYAVTPVEDSSNADSQTTDETASTATETVTTTTTSSSSSSRRYYPTTAAVEEITENDVVMLDNPVVPLAGNTANATVRRNANNNNNVVDADTVTVDETEVPLAVDEDAVEETEEKVDEVSIASEETPLAAAPQKNFFQKSWWWLLLLLIAVIGGGIAYAKKKSEDKKNTTK